MFCCRFQRSWGYVVLTGVLAGTLGVVAAGVGPSAARAAETGAAGGLAAHLDRACDFEASPWCRLPGDPKDSYITRDEALAISRGDKSARDRLWGWGGPKETFGGWGGAAIDGQRMYFFGGGHHHYRGNDIKVYDFETLSWSRLYDPAYVTTATHPAGNRRYIPEKGPRATHVYDGMEYVPQTHSLYMWGHYNFHGWRFDLEVWEKTGDPWQAWSAFDIPKGTRNNPPDFFRAAVWPDGQILLHGSNYARGRGDIFAFDPVGHAYTSTLRAQFVATALTVAGDRAYGRAAEHQRLNVYTREGRRVDTIDMPGGFSSRGMAYHPGRDLLVLWNGKADTLVYDLKAETWTQVGILADAAPQGAPNGPFGRWRYLPEHDIFVGLAKVESGAKPQAMWAYRLPDPLPEEHPLKVKRAAEGYTCSDEVAGWSCPDLQEQIATGTVQKGVYHQCAKVNRRVDFNGAWLKEKVCNRKAALIAGDGAVIENVKITDISIGSNANCVRWQRGAVTIRNMTCLRADMGLLGFGERLTLADSTFADTLDRGSNHGHVVYTCPREAAGSELILTNTTVRAAGDQGHVLKTGCATTRIENSVVAGGAGNYSRVIDAFNGGRLILRDSRLAAGESGGNGDLIGYGAEAREPLPEHRIEVRGGETDCRRLPAWGRALHAFPARVRLESLTWEPARNHGCRVE